MEELLQKLMTRMQEHPALLRLLRELPPGQSLADKQDWLATILATILYADALAAAPAATGDCLIQFARQLAAAQNPINENYNPRDPLLKPYLDRPLSPAAQARKAETPPDRWDTLQSFGDAMVQHYLKYQNYGGYLTGLLTVNPWQAMQLPLTDPASESDAFYLADRREDALWDASGPPAWITRHLYGQPSHSPTGALLAKYTACLPLYALDAYLDDGAETVLAEPVSEDRPGAGLESLRTMSNLFVGDALFCVLLQQYAAQKSPPISLNELDAMDCRTVHLKCMEKHLVTARNRYENPAELYQALAGLANLAKAFAPMCAETLQSDLAQAPRAAIRTWLVFFSYRYEEPLFDPGRVAIVTQMEAPPTPGAPLAFSAIGAGPIGAVEQRYSIPASIDCVLAWDKTGDTWQSCASGARFVPVDAALLQKILG